MRLVTYRGNPLLSARLGVVVDDMVVDVANLGKAEAMPLPCDILGFIDEGPSAIALLRALITGRTEPWPAGSSLPLVNVKLLAPIPRPKKNIFGIGLNYVEHVVESSRSLDTSVELPKEPVIFSKPPTAVIGPGDAIQHDASITRQLDWEVELAVIIGRTARRVQAEHALDYVFGYSVLIDISARDCRRAGQWIYSKGQDTYAPFGPGIVTTEDIPDPQALDLSLSVNGIEKQRSNTRYMLFNVKELIADISRGITLEPGDIIATGTPNGVGAGRNPPEWLWPGDVVEAEIAGIGKLRQPVVAI